MKYICLLLLGAFFAPSTFSQSVEEIAELKKNYPGEQILVLDELKEIHVELSKGTLNIYQKVYAKKLYLTPEAYRFNESSLGFSTFTSVSDVSAASYIPSGDKYKKIKVKEFKESDDMNSDVFHDDGKVISFKYSGLEENAMTELSYTRNILDPHFIERGILQWFYPTKHQILRVVVDKGIEMGFTEYQLDKDFITKTVKTEGNKTIYEWEVNNAPSLVDEQWSPKATYYAPQVFPRVKTYPSGNETIPVLRDENDLFAWYESMVDSVNAELDNPELQMLSDSITRNYATDLEKVQAVFEWTQDNVKYVAYEAGLGGFIPRSATTVCTNRFGDCKDMASTITTLLRYAGIKSHLTWIGTNAIPFTYSQLPTPAVDNHMIACYIDTDGTHYFMDATGRYMQFGMPSSFIQGKEALIQLEKGKMEIFKVPIMEPEVNIIHDSVLASIENGTFTGTANTYLGGYYKQNLSYRLEDLSVDEKSKFLKAYLVKGNNKFIPKNFSETNHYPNPEPLKVSYDFTIGDYAMANDNELYVNLNLMDFFAGDKLKEDRKTPFQFKYLSLYKTTVVFTIPSGYALDYVPKDVHLVSDLMEYHATYEVKGNQIIYTMSSHKKKLTYPATDVTLWNQNISIINKSQKNVVILKAL